MSGLLFPTTAPAQLEVRMRMEKQYFLRGEAVYCVLQLKNNSGRDLLMDRTGDGGNWLRFDIRDSNDANLSVARHEQPEIDPLAIVAGHTLERRINLTKLYPLVEPGDFKIHAQVYYQPGDTFFRSATEDFTVLPGRVIWEKTVGVPEGQEGAGETRIYELAMLSTRDGDELFFRMRRSKHSGYMTTFLIGKMVDTVNPQATIDEANRLHVMHVEAPQTLAHTVIGTDGEVIGQRNYSATVEKGYPRLMQGANGVVSVEGGVPLLKPEEIPEEFKKDAPTLSERPGGLSTSN